MKKQFIDDPFTGTTKFRVITLCGSLKFAKQFTVMQTLLERIGHVCLSVNEHEMENPPDEIEKSIIDKVHFKKIMLSDCILVLDLNYGLFPNYIGESTKHEIEFARLNNKEIFFVSQIGYSEYFRKNKLNIL